MTSAATKEQRTTKEQRERLRRYASRFVHADWELVVKVLDDFSELEDSIAELKKRRTR